MPRIKRSVIKKGILKSITAKTDLPTPTRLESWPKTTMFIIKNTRRLIPIRVKITGNQSKPGGNIEPANFLDFDTKLNPGEERKILFNITGGSFKLGIQNTIDIQMKASVFGLKYRKQFQLIWNTDIVTRSFVLMSTGKTGKTIQWVDIIDSTKTTGSPPNLFTNKIEIDGNTTPFSITINSRVSAKQTLIAGTDEQSTEFVVEPPFELTLTQSDLDNFKSQNARIIFEVFTIA